MRTHNYVQTAAALHAKASDADPYRVKQVYGWLVAEIVNSGRKPQPITVYGPYHKGKKVQGSYDLPRMNELSLGITEAALNLKLGDRASVSFERHFVSGGDDYVNITVMMTEDGQPKPPTVATVVSRVMALLGRKAYDASTESSFDVRDGQHFEVRLCMADYGITHDNVMTILAQVNVGVVAITKVPRAEPVTPTLEGDMLSLDVDLRGASRVLPWDDHENLHPRGEN